MFIIGFCLDIVGLWTNLAHSFIFTFKPPPSIGIRTEKISHGNLCFSLLFCFPSIAYVSNCYRCLSKQYFKRCIDSLRTYLRYRYVQGILTLCVRGQILTNWKPRVFNKKCATAPESAVYTLSWWSLPNKVTHFMALISPYITYPLAILDLELATTTIFLLPKYCFANSMFKHGDSGYSSRSAVF